MTAGEDTSVVRHERQGPVATVTMNRPGYRNTRNSALTYALDGAFRRAADDGGGKVVDLAHAHSAETAAAALAGAGIAAMRRHTAQRSPRHRQTGS
ncbi:hypothetical protein GCM10010211_39120 [Streptomyces albospinus]|uniref:Enoyl-CoA hydratase n=1 Tax=Streptomyces albospinus TaxID=285515 RepID=A0ABQ2V773_9ACTN|nr:hypothetical protein GCM10010211_39120 [Streptomyces albospinus]